MLLSRQPTVPNRVGRVLVLGSEPHMTLPVIRSLGRQGLRVHLAFGANDSICRFSRYISKIHMLPSIELSRAVWIKTLQRLIERWDFDLVIPVTEDMVFSMQINRTAWGQYPCIYLIHDRAFEIVFDKSKTYQIAESLGIPIPRTTILDNSPQTPRRVADVALPAIVKPALSVDNDNVGQKKYVRRISCRQDLLTYAQYLLRKDATVVIQEVVPGRGLGVEILAYKGRILFAFQHQRLHETTGFGSTYRKSVHLTPELFKASSRLMEALQYTGVAMIEFRRNEETGSWVLLEINGRFWGSLPLAVAAGADFPWYLYQMIVAGKRYFPSGYRTNVYCRRLLDDARWVWRTLSGQGHVGQEMGWGINRCTKRQLIADFTRALLLLDTIDSFAWDDLGPLRGELRSILSMGVRKFSQGYKAAL